MSTTPRTAQPAAAGAIGAAAHAGAAPRLARLASSPFAAPLLAAALAGAYLIFSPYSGDLAAATYRADLFSRVGFALWNNQWYAGHHTLAYSVVFPPLGSLLGPRLVGALSAVAAAALFTAIARRRFGVGWAGQLCALWFAFGVGVSLLSSRISFTLGLAIGLGALLAAQRGRAALAVALAALAALATPLAGAFVALAGLAWALADRHEPRAARRGLALAAAGLLPVLALVLAFPEGGFEPWGLSSFLPALVLTVVLALAFPREEHALRIGAVLYGLAIVAAYAVATPVGGNVGRLGTLFAAPLAVATLWGRRPLLLALLVLPLGYWQVDAPLSDYAVARGDASVQRAYYAPLLSFLESRPGGPFRIEIPFTRIHWETVWVAPRVALARGWERQLDERLDPLFYHSPLTDAGYRAWLNDNAVSYVALPNARLDSSARAEARLIERGPAYLRPVWSAANWRVFAVAGAAPIASGVATLTRLDPNAFTLRANRAGTAIVRVHFTPYWALRARGACVSRAPGDWTRVRLPGPGSFRVTIDFALGRVFDHGPRCG